MWVGGTIAYPWIMLDRQVQSIAHCTYGSQEFAAAPFGFVISVPNELCILPHRIFPEDTSIQILPRGFYSVWNEYAKGTVIDASVATLLFENMTPERNSATIFHALDAGGFLLSATTTTYKTPNGFTVTEVHNATGIESGKLFDWAFIDHPDGKYTLSILSSHPEDPTIFHKIITSLKIGVE
jgi:hypothetical protein